MVILIPMPMPSWRLSRIGVAKHGDMHAIEKSDSAMSRATNLMLMDLFR